jgi:TolA-binding protein
MFIRLIALFAFFYLIFVPPEASAQQEVDARLNRIENEIQTLSRALFRGDVSQAEISSVLSQDAPIQAELELRVSQLENEIRTLTGLVEQQNFQVTQLRGTIDSLLADLEDRVTELEKNERSKAPDESLKEHTSLNNITDVPKETNSSSLTQADFTEPEKFQNTNSSNISLNEASDASITKTTQSLGVLPVTKEGELKEFTAVSTDSPIDAYERAFSILREKNYIAAEQAFLNFLSLYPEHELAGNAKYWLGETFYVRGNYQRAAQNLLKLGMSLSQLDQKEDACLALSQIKRKFSSGAGPVLNRAEQEMEKLSCL